MSWTPARDREKYGVAIYNYDGITESCIKLNVGDQVHILEELGAWYFGYCLHNRDLRGVFPKSFIQVRECIVDKSGSTEVVIARVPPIVQEVTAVLREWGVLLRKLYVERHKDFQLLQSTMMDLITYRGEVLSGQLPTDELRQLKYKITSGIDLINRRLGLDLVVRNDKGNILNPDITSAVKLFRHHESAAAYDIEKCEGVGRISSVRRRPHLAWTAFINIKNIVIKVPEQSEISLGLYMGDPNQGTEKPLTENYIISWSDNGYSSNPELLGKLKCVFTDLSGMVLENGVWLMGTVVRQGSMASKEVDPRRTSTVGLRKNIPNNDSMRRPYGVILLELTSLVERQRAANITCPPIDEDKNEELCALFYPCGEKETLDLKKLLSSRGDAAREGKSEKAREQGTGIWFTFSLVNGDIKKIREENSHLVELRELPVAYYLGLSEVVMPGDVRNDLYVTLVSGEFSRGAKTSDRNVEVTVRICDEKGVVVPGVIYQGCGKIALDEYRSVTYHHEAKPKWAETFKIALPIEEFKKAHVKFTFKHRSTNDMKDKNEKPFAMSFMKLMQNNGTTLHNTDHELIVYKIDSKKWNDNDFAYLDLAWLRQPGEELSKAWKGGLSPTLKDSFTISTIFCSTKLTQNAALLRLLELGWGGKGAENGALENSLEGLKSVPSDELMIFLQDTLDVLLEILMNNSASDASDNKIFEALIDVITIATDKNKHEAFQPVLDSYIRHNFHATLAYNKLIHVLKFYVENGEDKNRQNTLKKAMKCLQYVFKFIIRSRQLFLELYGKGQEEFEKSLHQLLEAMAGMMLHTSDATLTVQAQCLRYITTTIPDIITTFDPVIMSGIIVSMVDNLDSRRIPKQRLMTINEVIHSELFKIPACRRVLLPSFIKHVRRLLAAAEEETDSTVVMRKQRQTNKLTKLLGDHVEEVAPQNDRSLSEELELCVKIMGDILDVLFSTEVGPTIEDISSLSSLLLEDIISIVLKMIPKDPLLSKMVSVLVSLMRQMTDRHFLTYFNHLSVGSCFDGPSLPVFLLELLNVIDCLVSEHIFPSDWAEMLLLQNSVIVKVLRLCSRVISEKLRDPFRVDVFSKFFHTAINFITQPSLQLENFTQSKRNKILSRYKDMRRETGIEVKNLWFSLDDHKITFVAGEGPSLCMVGPFLKMTMLPGIELRKQTIPIFFDMMQCEFYSMRESSKSTPEQPVMKPKHRFNEFEKEMLEKLDHLVESGHGDSHYKDMFEELVGALCCQNNTMREPGRKLVGTITRLLDRLLQYRTIMNTPDNSNETRMSCLVNLLDFYSEINRKELYLRYVYKLSKLHIECDNFTEAGYTLKQHAQLLHWTPDPLTQALRSPDYPYIDRHDQLKEKLYMQIIDHFDKGKMWEDALVLCKELVKHYEEEVVDYNKLSELLKRMANFYSSIMNPQNLRPEPEYFRVAYYGRGFPLFLQNKVFVYRGNGFERLADFTSRILDQFPNAEPMKKLTPPSDDIKESPQQYVQISKVDCVPEIKPQFLSPSVSDQIRKHYRANDVHVFTYSRPFHQGHKDPSNEFATLCIEKTTLHTRYSLPGILRCFPVIKTTIVELSPLENAVDTMTTANSLLYDIVRRYAKDVDRTLPLHMLTRKISGMVDAAVMGGISNYEKAFLTPEYIASHPEDEDNLENLKQLIAAQVPLLEVALSIHTSRKSDAEAGLHQHMVTSFTKMKAEVQEKYGQAEVPDDLKAEVRPLRLPSNFSINETTGRSSYLYTNNDGISLSGSQSSLSRYSTASKAAIGGTLPRHHKISSAHINGTPSKSNKKDSNALTRFLTRRESFTTRESSTQWFDPVPHSTTTQQPIIELTEQVTTPVGVNQIIPQRPKRLDTVDMLSSRPTSLTLTSPPATPSPSMGSRESLASTSTTTESMCEDERPPLPAKQRDHDNEAAYRLSSSALNTCKGLLSFPLDLPSPSEDPPKKPPRPDKNHNHEDPSLQ